MRWVALLVVVVAGCQAMLPQATSTPMVQPVQALTCDGVIASSQQSMVCLEVDAGSLILQTPAEQVMVQGNDFTVTYDATIHIHTDDEAQVLTIAVLEGVGVIGAGGVTRIVQTGAQVSMLYADPGLVVDSAPSDSVSYQPDDVLAAAVEELVRPIALPIPIRQNPLTAVVITETPTGCVRPTGWIRLYEIRRGDTISGIAGRFEITMDEIIEFNCLVNVSRISPGDKIYLPTVRQVVATLEPDTTSEPLEVTFYVDHETIQRGDCTTIYWEAAQATVVYFQGEASSRTDSRQMCPELTTTYTLLAVATDGGQYGYTVTIRVE